MTCCQTPKNFPVNVKKHVLERNLHVCLSQVYSVKYHDEVKGETMDTTG